MANQPELKSTGGYTPSENQKQPIEQISKLEQSQSSEIAGDQITPEKLPSSESPQVDTQADQETGAINKALGGLRQILGRSKTAPPSIPIVKDETMVQVEKIMEEDLVDAYKSLSTIQKQEFKIKGEQTAYQIRELLNKTHVKIKKIFKLILEWLLLLPGINRFYLEQEAKIKADKILMLKKINDGDKK